MIVGGPSPPSPSLRRTGEMLLGTVGLVSLFAACSASGPTGAPPAGGPFSSDVAFLRQHTDVVLLTDASGGAQVAVAPGYQGRVMTSTTGGSDGPSFGWIGRAAVSAGSRQPHMNVFGGKIASGWDRKAGNTRSTSSPAIPSTSITGRCRTPSTGTAWQIASQTSTEVRFRKRMALVNYSRTSLTLDVDRTVRLLTSSDASAQLGATPGPAVRVVAFESSNTVTNAGDAPWQSESGLPSIWILGQFNPSLDHDDCHSFHSRLRVRARTGRERRLLWKGAGRPSCRAGRGAVVPR